MTGIADTGFLVAFLNRRDRHHQWAIGLAACVDQPLFTCEAVLAEAVFHIGSARLVLALLDTHLIKLNFDLTLEFPRIQELAAKYEDRQPDLADLCLVCLSERHRNHAVLTVDGDFCVYRRNQRESIPVIMPADG